MKKFWKKVSNWDVSSAMFLATLGILALLVFVMFTVCILLVVNQLEIAKLIHDCVLRIFWYGLMIPVMVIGHLAYLMKVIAKRICRNDK